MNFAFESFGGMVLVFSEGYLVDSNEAAQRGFNSYGFSLLGKPMDAFMPENEIKRVLKESTGGRISIIRLTLFDGKQKEFEVRKVTDEQNDEFVIFSEKNVQDEEKWLMEEGKIYDPMMMGKAEIYKQELTRRIDFLCEQLRMLESSALIRKDSELYSSVKTIRKTVKIMEHREGRAITDFADSGGGFVKVNCAFGIGRLAELLTDKAKSYLLLENYPVTVNFSTLRNYGVYGDYMKIGRALSVLLVAAIKNVIASGRRGRINVSVRQSGKRVRIMIVDNGIGLSEKTFERLYSDGKIPSGLECFRSLAGVGISDAVRWIEENGGEVYTVNDTHKGTATEVFLPLCTDACIRTDHLISDIDSAVCTIFEALKE